LEPAIEPQLYAPHLSGLTEVTQIMLKALQSNRKIEVGANVTVNTDQNLPIAKNLTHLATKFAGPAKGVTTFGTAGFHEPAGLSRFARTAEIARAAELPIVTHADQTGGPNSVAEALDELGATRISHGKRTAESPDLLRRLAGERIVCDVCPAS